MKKRYSPEQIVGKLRQADVQLGRQMKALEKENARLKRLVADQTLVDVELDVRVGRQPEKVTLEPDGSELSHEYAEGRVRVPLPIIKGAAVVVLRGALT